MAQFTKQDRETLIGWFPRLASDNHFQITSECTPLYNCIGWALGLDDVWVALDHPSNMPWIWWPKGVPATEKQSSLIALFAYFGFEKCNDAEAEDGFDKVALYGIDGNWTHAARVVAKDEFHSKIGTAWDIHHSNGDVFADTEYGEVFAYMKRLIVNRHLSQDLRPQAIRYCIDGVWYTTLVNQSNINQ